MRRRLSQFLLATLVTGWIFTGWPQVFDFPPDIPKAQAISPAFEAGEIEVSDSLDWTTITLDNTYSTAPVILATPVTHANCGTPCEGNSAGQGGQYPIPLVRNVTTTSFDISMCIDGGNTTCDTGASAETFHWFAFDVDDAASYDWIEAGTTATVDVGGADTPETYSTSFAATPDVWTQSQTYSQGSGIGAHAWVEDNGKTTSGFTYVGCVHTGTADACDAAATDETFGYVAIDVANEAFPSSVNFQSSFADITNSVWTAASFSPSYTTPRVMVTQNDDDGGQDPEYAWARDVVGGGMDYRYCEEDAGNVCHTHTGEKTYWFAIEQPLPSTVTGNVYSDEGFTALTSRTVALSVSGATVFTTADTDGAGQYTMTVTGAVAGSVLTLFLQDESEDAVTVTVTDASTMTGVDLYQNRLILRNETGGVITNAQLATADDSGDSDIISIYSMTDGDATLQSARNIEVFVWTGSFIPGGRIKTHDLDVRGTLTLGTNGMTASGSITASGSVTTSTGVVLTSTDDFEKITATGVTFANLTLDSGLVAYWRMDEGSGATTIRDSSRHQNNGTWNGSTLGDTQPQWKQNPDHTTLFYNPQTLSFDGTDDYVDVDPTNVILPFTVSAWIQPGTDLDGEAIWSYADSSDTDHRHILVIDDTQSDAFGTITTGTESTSFATTGAHSSTTASAGTWYHIVGVWGANDDRRIHVNGIQEDTNTFTVNASGLDRMWIGRLSDSTPNWEFDGLIDDVRLYNRILSNSEVATLASGSQGTGSGHYILGSALSVSGDLAIFSSTLDAGNNYPITLSGSWINHGNFTKQSATVTLDGSSQSMSGNTLFNDLTKIVSSSATLLFDHASRQSVSGALTLNGASSNLLSLRSNLSGSASNILLDGSAGTYNLQYLDVQDNDASGGTTLICLTSAGCVDSGNTTNWLFSGGADVTLGTTPFDNEMLDDSTPDFEFSGDDPDGSADIIYQIQIDDTYDFSSVVVDCESDTSCGTGGGSFINTQDGGDTDPFTEGQTIRFTPTTTLSNNTTYYWRVRAEDDISSGGAGTYGSYSSIRSFTVSGSTIPSQWFQTTDEQFDQGTFSSTATGSDSVTVSGGGGGGSTDIQVAVGTFRTPGSTGTDSVTGVGFQPKALLLWGVPTTVASVDSSETSHWIGFADSAGTPNERTAMMSMDNNLTGNNDFNSGAVLSILESDDDIVAVATVDSYDSNGFTLDYTTATADYIVNYIAFSGDDLEAAVGESVANDSPLSGLSFQPELVFTSTAGQECNPILGSSVPVQGFGVFNATDEIWLSSFEGLPLLFTKDAAVLTTGFSGENSNGSLVWETSFSSFTSDGFSWTGGESDECFYYLALSLGGAGTDVGTFTAETSGTEPTDQDLPDLGFTPQAYGLISGGTTATSVGSGDEANSNVGAFDGTNQASITRLFGINDGIWQRTSTSAILGITNDDTGQSYEALATAQAISDSSPTVTWNPNDTTAYVVGYWAIEEGAGVSTGSILSPEIDYSSVSGASSWGSVYWTESGSDVLMQVYYTDSTACDTIISDGQISGNSSGITSSPINISGLDTGTYDTLCLQATLSGATAILQSWGVSWSDETTIAGTVYSDEGFSALTSRTVAVSVSGATVFTSAETDGGGQYIATFTGAVAGSVITLFLQDESEDAVTVTIGSGSSMTGVHLYQNRLIVRNETGGTITNTHLATGDNSGDSDIASIYSMIEGDAVLQSARNVETFVWAGTTYVPGGRIKTHDLDVRGTLTLGTNGLTASGSITASGSVTTSTGVILTSVEDFEKITGEDMSFVDLTLQDGLVGYWKLDEGSGSTVAYDSSPNGYDGTWEGASLGDTEPQWKQNPDHTTLFFNPQALGFDGTDDYIETNISSNDVFADKTFTTTFWVKDDTSGSNMILAKGGFTTGFFIQPARVQIKATGDTVLDQPSDGSIDMEDGEWHFAAIVVTTDTNTQAGNTAYIYQDGALHNGTAVAGSSAHEAASDTVNIGRRSQNASYFAGQIDDVRLYNRGLSASEIATLASGSQGTGSGYYILGSALSVSGDLAIHGSTLDVSTDNNPVTVSGSWINHGGFVKQSGTVTLNGTSQSMSGNTIFNNLTKTVTSTATLLFDNTSRQSVSGALTLNGASSNLLSLRSNLSGSASNLMLDGSAGTQDLEYLDVQDNDASGGATLNCLTGCNDSGNTTNWNFGDGGLVITGSVYSNEGFTALTSRTVAVSVSGATVFTSAETDSGGQYIASFTGAVAGSVLTLFLQDESEDAVTVTIGSGAAMTGVHLYQNRLILRNETGGTITNTHLATGDNSGDSDIAAIYGMIEGDAALQAARNIETFVWTGTTYIPSGRVKTHDLDVRGTLTLGTNGLTASGSITASGSVTTSTGVLLTSTEDFEKITGEDMSFVDLTLQDGLVGYWKLDEGSGSTVAYDSSPNGYDGSWSGASSGDTEPQWKQDPNHTATFFNPQALGFDGTDDFIDIATPPITGYPHTLCGWVRTFSDTDSGIVWIGDEGTVSNYFSISASVGNFFVYYFRAGSDDWITAGNPSADTWYHVCGASRASNDHELFVDGSSIGTSSANTNPSGFDSAAIGSAQDSSPTYCHCITDDIRIYNRALSSSEIESLANGNPSTGSGRYILGSALSVSGDLTVYGSTLDVSTDNNPVTVSGSWINHGDFLKQGGTVTLNGTSQSMSGNTIFNNLTKTVTSTATLLFDNTSRQSVSGALTLNGASSNLLSLRSNLTGSASNLMLDGSAGTQDLEYLDVQDNDASGGATLNCLTGCNDSGNTTNWNFGDGGLVITGSVYSNEGFTALASRTVAVSVDGDSVHVSAETDGGGQYSMTFTGSTAGSVLTLFLQDESEDAVTVTIGSGAAMTGVHLYQNRLILRNETGGTITNTHLATGDNSGDSDIAAIYGMIESNTALQAARNIETFVWTSTTYVPGGRIKTHDLDVRGTLTLGTSGLTASGSITASGSVTTSTGVLLTSAEDFEKITGEDMTFNNLTIDNGLVGHWKLDDGSGSTVARDSSRFGNHGALTGDNLIWVANPSHTGNSYNPYALDLGGSSDYVNAGEVEGISGANALTVAAWVQGTDFVQAIPVAKHNGSTDGSFYIAYLDANTHRFALINSSSTRVDHDVAVSPDSNWHHFAGVYNGTDMRIILDGSQIGGTSAQSGPVKAFDIGLYIGDYGGLSWPWDGLVDDVRVYNRALSSSELESLANGNQHTGSGRYILGSALSVNGNLSIHAGLLDVSSDDNPITLSGSWINYGGFEKQSGTVTLNGTSQTMSGNTVFHNLTKSVTSADTLKFDHTARQSASGALTLKGVSGNLLTLRSTLSGSASNLLLDGSAGTQDIEYADVQDNDASGGATLNCLTGCTDSGNTTNWNFGGGFRNFFFFGF